MSRAEVSGVAVQVNVCKALGKLEVVDPEDNDYPKASKSLSLVNDSPCPECAVKPPVSFENGKLQVLGPKEEEVIPAYDAAVRPRSAAGRPGSAGRKSSIPTKQIPVCTVKPIAHSSNIPDCGIPPSMQTNKPGISTMQKMSSEPEDIQADEKETAGPQSLTIHDGNIKERLEESSDEDESDDEPGRAPLQLLAEFVNAVMDEDYQLAQKLTRMILIYEPENLEAKEFSLLIDEMLQIVQQESSEDEDSEDSDDETDEDTGDTDDDKNPCTAEHIS